MTTSNLSQTAPLIAAPSLPPLLAWVSGVLHRIQALQMPAVGMLEPSEQTYHQISFPATPLLFPRKSIYTPREDWKGYR